MNFDIHNELAQLGEAFADKTRAKLLCTLMDGKAYTATELTAVSDVSASTISAHLAKLVQQNLISYVKQGRFRYFKLKSPQIAATIESLMSLTSIQPLTIKSKTPEPLKLIRTCYDHMAGEIAVKILNFMLNESWLSIDDTENNLGYQLTSKGEKEFKKIKITLPPKAIKRCFARPCLDWSERKDHLAGALGNTLLNSFIDHQWVQDYQQVRVLTITDEGQKALLHYFDINLH